ncbi:MAG: transglutaminase domain-containing protein [Planctomycetota bacterium]|nr:MAG: transglutaminase domain-containing protein [Planctomycetota bacterium]
MNAGPTTLAREHHRRRAEQAHEHEHRLRRGLFHSMLLIVAATYLGWMYPLSQPLIAVLLGVALVCEWGPLHWRRWFVPEILLLSSGLATYLWSTHLDAESTANGHILGADWSFAGWIRMVLIFWSLIPSRAGMARVFAGMVIGELLLLSAQANVPGIAIVWLLCLAILAWAGDEWLRGSQANDNGVSVSSARPLSLWSRLLPMALAIAILSTLASAAVSGLRSQPESAEANPLHRSTGEQQRIDFDDSFGLNDEHFSDDDHTITARLEFDPSQFPPHHGMWYLRAATAPQVYLDNGSVRWRSGVQPHLSLQTAPDLHHHHEPQWATLFRAIGSGDMVLRPDHSLHAEVGSVLGDAHGNLFRPGLGDFPRRYRVDLGSESAPPSPFEQQNRALYTQVVPAVRQMLSHHLPDIARWKELSPEQAARSIHNWLRLRATYELHDLPQSMAGDAGDLRGFLFGSEEQRRGHCVHFTTATVLLLRASGHPARPVFGYASNEWDEQGVTFRSLHAHAWTEFHTSTGLWQRLETTPTNALQERFAEGLGNAEGSAGWNADEYLDADHEESAPTGMWHPLWWFALPAGIIIGLILRPYWGSKTPSEQRLQTLSRHSQSLLRCAQECGVMVTPSTTLSSIAHELEQRSSIPLQDTLRAHLAARFGDGPLPPPWPVKEIRRMYRLHQQSGPGH